MIHTGTFTLLKFYDQTYADMYVLKAFVAQKNCVHILTTFVTQFFPIFKAQMILSTFSLQCAVLNEPSRSSIWDMI